MTKNFWTKKWGKDKICNITFSRIRPGKNINGIPYCIKLNCNHSFYTSALLEWCNNQNYNNTNTCPVCRKDFDIFDVILNKITIHN